MSGEEENSLKQLHFVPEYGSKGYKMANGAYEAAKAYVPEPLKERLVKVEETVGAATAPYVTKAQDTGTALLKNVDSKVCLRVVKGFYGSTMTEEEKRGGDTFPGSETCRYRSRT